MALLDFIKNRQQQPTEQAPAKQETARDYHARQDAQDKAALKPVDALPQQPKAELNEVKARMEKATQHLNQGAGATAPAPQDGASSPEPSRQNMASQDKAAPENSPTSMQAGTTAWKKTSRLRKLSRKPRNSPPRLRRLIRHRRHRRAVAADGSVRRCRATGLYPLRPCRRCSE